MSLIRRESSNGSSFGLLAYKNLTKYHIFANDKCYWIPLASRNQNIMDEWMDNIKTVYYPETQFAGSIITR